MSPLQPVRGTTDHLPELKAAHHHVTDTALAVSQLYGYAEMATPIFEFTEVFSRPLGASSDVVTKETYSFEDRGGSSLTLRPEGTAAAMRAVISNGLTQTLPHRWFYQGPMFRYERPQKGRMRQFHQIGAEYIGVASAQADAEIIALGAHILSALGVLDKTVLHLNTLGDTQSRLAYRDALTAYLEPFKAELSEDSQRRLSTNPLRILDSKNETDRRLIADAPHLSDYLNDTSKAHFDQLTSLLTKANIAFEHDELLVRGLDYYAHSAFEFITSALGAQGTVLGGGRYDGLSEMLGGPELPAVGFAAGVERLALLAAPPAATGCDIAICAADKAAEAEAFGIAQQLRGAGCQTVMLSKNNLGKNLKAADRLGALYCVIIGSDELTSHQVMLRQMRDGHQELVAIDGLASHLSHHIALTKR